MTISGENEEEIEIVARVYGFWANMVMSYSLNTECYGN